MGQQFIVVGPGWLGSAVADALEQTGGTVWTMQRSASPSSSGAHRHALQGDIRDLASTPANPAAGAWQDLLPSRVDGIVVCVAPSRSAGDRHESTYPAAVRGALQLAVSCGCPRILYTSSTGVYGRSDGGVSDEQDVISVRDPRQGALRDAELELDRSLDSADIDRIVLRVAGLYGPGRDPSGRFRATIPAGDADVWCNFSWRDDVVSAIVDLMTAPIAPHDSAGTTAPRARIFNCADGSPLRASAIARALGAVQLSTPSEAMTAGTAARSNQQITAQRLRSTGWAPRMATVFDGLRALGHDTAGRA